MYFPSNFGFIFRVLAIILDFLCTEGLLLTFGVNLITSTKYPGTLFPYRKGYLMLRINVILPMLLFFVCVFNICKRLRHYKHTPFPLNLQRRLYFHVFRIFLNTTWKILQPKKTSNQQTVFAQHF